MTSVARVLVIAGSDSGGGAGIQADLKTIMALGGFATTAVTAVTAQNTLGVAGVWPVPPAFVALQISTVLADIGTDAIKTGMLVDAPTIAAVAAALAASAAPLVLDPVMVAKGGAPLLAPEAVELLRALLFPRATLLTPNVPEAAVLTGIAIEDLAGMRRAAARLCRDGARAVLIKGGHLPGAEIATQAGHGTGCTLASAIALGLAQGRGLAAAVELAREYLLAALATGLALGGGHQPLDHAAGRGRW